MTTVTFSHQELTRQGFSRDRNNAPVKVDSVRAELSGSGIDLMDLGQPKQLCIPST